MGGGSSHTLCAQGHWRLQIAPQTSTRLFFSGPRTSAAVFCSRHGNNNPKWSQQRAPGLLLLSPGPDTTSEDSPHLQPHSPPVPQRQSCKALGGGVSQGNVRGNSVHFSASFSGQQCLIQVQLFGGLLGSCTFLTSPTLCRTTTMDQSGPWFICSPFLDSSPVSSTQANADAHSALCWCIPVSLECAIIGYQGCAPAHLLPDAAGERLPKLLQSL